MAAFPGPDRPVAERWYFRHAALVRATHWINAVCFVLLLMSGLQIFNAHPALYVGEQSDFDHPAMSIRARLSENGLVGETMFAGHSFDTSGILGISNEDGQISQRAFPSWITIPNNQDLATGRRWHFPAVASSAMSEGRSLSICACASHAVQRRGGTMCCSSLPISWSSSSCSR